MPQILADYLELVFYVYNSESEANDAEPQWDTGGTGFFAAVPFEGRENEGSLYAVTAAHVVQKQPEVFLRINQKEGGFAIIRVKQSAWHLHPSGDDIAVSPIDDSALNVYALPTGQFLSTEIDERYAIGPGDEIFVVGRFINHEGRQRNTPTVRFGNIAMMPIEPIPNRRTGREHLSYLVETRSQSGYSGAPVFVYVAGGVQRTMGTATGSLLSAKGPWLLGVLWGYTQVRGESNELGQIQTFQTGLAGVVPVSRLVELLEGDPLRRLHREAEARRKERDTGGSGEAHRAGRRARSSWTS